MIRRNAILTSVVAAAVLLIGAAGTFAQTDAELLARAKNLKPHGRNLHLASGEAKTPTDGSFRVFLLAGQSNMVGQGQASEFSASQVAKYRKPNPRVLIWADDRWQYLVPSGRFGPEVAFAHEMAERWPDQTIGIIKIAIGGTGICAFESEWTRKRADRSRDAHKGPLYVEMIESIRDARKVSKFELAGFAWKQGGKDGRNVELGREYLDNLTKLIADLRRDTGEVNLPAFICTVLPLEQLKKRLADPGIQARLKTRPGMADVLVAQSKIENLVPNTRGVYHNKLPCRADGIHFNTEGQLTLGRMIADKVESFYKK